MRTFIKKLLYRFFYLLRKPDIYIYEAKLSGDGNLIDIRYWLSRPDKLNSNCSIFLTDDDTGEKLRMLQIPKFGAIQTRHSKHLNAGNLLLYNRNGLVKSGSKVTLHFDNLFVRGIAVK
jgi:hypothetical protein